MASGIYKLYTDNNVFAAAGLNLVCNQLMQGLIDEAFGTLNDSFALAGDAAFHFETDTPGPIHTIKFKTDSEAIYKFLAQNLERICPSILGLQTYQEGLIARFPDSYIEFYLENSITTHAHLGIYVTN